MRCFVLGLALFAMTAAPPVAARADDNAIAEHIVSRLKAEKDQGNLQGFNIDLEIDQGSVYLNGYVSAAAQEELAIDIARRAAGVKRVYNGLEIKPQCAKTCPTPAIASNDEPAKPQQNSLRRVTPTEVAASDKPAAPQPFTLQTAVSRESVAADQDSEVTQAQAELPSQPSSISSREIAEQIVAELKQAKSNGDLKGFAIDVEVRRGEVWLKGQVSNSTQEELAIDIARRTHGVKQVVNALTVTGDAVASTGSGVEHAVDQRVSSTATMPSASDSYDSNDSDAIAREVLNRLQAKKREGSLRNFGIDVQVDDRTVWISGYVSSKEQEQLVLDVARFTPGVGQVVNDLTITSTNSASTAPDSVLGTPVGQLAEATTAAPSATATPAAAEAPMAPMQAWGPYAYYPPAYGGGAGVMQPQSQMPLAFAPAQPVNHVQPASAGQPSPISMGAGSGVGIAPARFDHPQMPGYAWPSYAAYPNYAGVTYPQQYSASAWPYIGPFYPYPQVPLGWRRATLEWDDGWWHLKFRNKRLH